MAVLFTTVVSESELYIKRGKAERMKEKSVM